MMWKVKKLITVFLNRFTAFEGRGFLFQMLVLTVIFLNVFLVIRGLYLRVHQEPSTASNPNQPTNNLITKAK